MRVLFFLGFPNPFPGAAWTRVGFFSTYLAERGHRVDVAGIFSPRAGRRGFSRWRGIGLWNICPVFSVDSIPSRILNIPLAFLALVPLLLAKRPDVVVISVPTGGPAIGAYFAARFTARRVVIDYRDEWEDYDVGRTPPGPRRRAYERLRDLMSQIYRRSDLVLTVTEALAQGLRSRGVGGVKVLTNGADTAVFKPLDRVKARDKLRISQDSFVLIYSGAIRYYRFDVVLRAMAQLGSDFRDGSRLVLVGQGPDLPRVRDISQELGLADALVHLEATDDHSELAEILSSADVGLVPYDDNPLWRNSLPAKFYEYCACGLPVIATVYDDALLARLVKEYGIGLTVPPLDEGRLSRAMALLRVDAEGRRAMGERARKMVVERFDRRAVAQAFLEDLEALVKGSTS